MPLDTADNIQFCGRYLPGSAGLENGQFTYFLVDAASRIITHEFVPTIGFVGRTAPAVINVAEPLQLSARYAESITLKALNNNNSPVYIGFDNGLTSANGYELFPGESISLSILSIADIWVLNVFAGDSICWLGVENPDPF